MGESYHRARLPHFAHLFQCEILGISESRCDSLWTAVITFKDRRKRQSRPSHFASVSSVPGLPANETSPTTHCNLRYQRVDSLSSLKSTAPSAIWFPGQLAPSRAQDIAPAPRMTYCACISFLASRVSHRSHTLAESSD